MSFWWRRWLEQSRSPIQTAFPWVSAKTCISTWRGQSRYRSRYTSELPKYAWPSLRAESRAAAASSGALTTFMPRPPPPYDALMATGQPWTAPKAWISSAEVTGPSLPGTTGTPASIAATRDDTLSPITSMASGGGPTNVAPREARARAKAGFSLKKP